MMERRLVLGLAFAGWMALHCLPRSDGAAPEVDSPEAVAKRSFDALNQGKIDGFVAAMHPEALRKFRDALSVVVAKATEAGQSDQVLELFGNVKDVAALKQLDDAQYFAAYMRGVTSRDPEIMRSLAQSKVATLGQITEGPDTVHVVYRLTMNYDGSNLDRVNVASLRKEGSRWAILLTSEVEGMIAMLNQRVAGKFELPDFKASTIEVLGRVPHGQDQLHVVYRMTTPAGSSAHKGLGVASFEKSDPAWGAVRNGSTEELNASVKSKLGL